MIHESPYYLSSLFQDLGASLYGKCGQSEEFLLKHPHNHRWMHTKPITDAKLKQLQSGETSFILHTTQNKDAQFLRS
jgi:hypothetical protein